MTSIPAYLTPSIAFMERATARPALALLTKAGVFDTNTQDKVLLDSACGVAILSAELFRQVELRQIKSRTKVYCGDVQSALVNVVKTRIAAEGWTNTEAIVADAEASPFPTEFFDYVLSNFGQQVFLNGRLALLESKRTLKPGGIVGFTSWTQTGWLRPLQSAIPSFPAPPLYSGPWTQPEVIRAVCSALGLRILRSRHWMISEYQ